MNKITVYGTEFCTYCRMAENLLIDKGFEVEKIDLTNNAEERDNLIERTGRRTVPQIFIGPEFIGGFKELRQLETSGELYDMINKKSEES